MPEITPSKDAPKPVIAATMGDITLLEQHKTAFLCSRQIPAGAVLRCYDWATSMRDAGQCVLSGFHSQIEKDVLHFLLKGTQPIILATARGIGNHLPGIFAKPLQENRLLLITPFPKEIKRVTSKTAMLRNKLMLEIADAIVVGYANPLGELNAILKTARKPMMFLFGTS